MSRTIDQKVVEMQFDNRQFERNVSTTMSSVEKLKQSLNFTGASKGLEDVGTATKKIDMAGLGSAVDAVKVKFSALQVMGVTALSNITNSALNAGKRIASALTIDPIKTGFQEYETQINAVQTILANTQSKGSTLSDVNAALDELNTYADQTIYNFTEMTKNIGTFTAAGVDLDKSVQSIKGIANLAAVSGSNAQQASTAMYQLSQALAAGKVSLMDWNSVVNAGMGGEVFQTALKRTAENFGYNVDGMIKKYGSFRESLTEGGWLTAEVLTETLTQLSGAYSEADLVAQGYSRDQAKAIVELAETAVSAATDVKTFTQLWDTLKESAQSGWTQTWEILIGDFEEAKDLLGELYTTFSDIIGQSAEARNTLLYDSMTSNWKKITDGITEAGLSAEDFKDKVSEIGRSEVKDFDKIVQDAGSLEAAFKSGALSSDLLDKALIKMTGSTEEISGKLEKLRGEYKTNDDILKALNKAGYENADIQDLIAKSTSGQTIALNDLSDAQLMSIGYTADQVKSIRQLSEYAELAGGSLQKFIDNVSVSQGRELLVDSLRISLRSLIDIFGRVGDAWREVFPPMTSDGLLDIIKSIKEFTLAMRPSEETLDKLQRTFRGLFSILNIGKQAFIGILSPLTNLMDGFGDLTGSILDTTATFGDWLYSLSQNMSTTNPFSSLGNGISVVLEKILDGIRLITDHVGGLTGVFSSIGKGIVTVFESVFDVIGRVADWIRENITAGDIFAGLAGGGIFMLVKKLSGLIDKIKDMFNFGGKDDKDGLGSKFGEVLDSIHGSLESFQQGIQVASLVGIATAIMLLTSSVRTLSEIDAVKVGYSLVAIGVMIATLNAGFKSLAKTLSKFNSGGTIKASLAMIAIAEAVNILASAMVKLSDLSWGEVVKGLAGVGGAMLALSASIKLIGKGGVTLRTSVAILALAEACKMLATALEAFGSMEWGEIARGLTAMGIALAEFTAVMAVLSKVGGGRSLLGATSILIAVQSLDEISENLKRLGSLSWEQIEKGLIAMGFALAEFTASLSILSKVGGFGSVLGGTAILIAVQSLDEISENLKRLGDMDWDEIDRGLVAMGGALLELGTVVGLLGKLTGFSGILGATAILIGVQGLKDLALSLQEFGTMLWDEIGRGLVAMGGALTELGVVVGVLGKLTGLSGLMGAGAVLISVQGLDDLAMALQKFGSMSWDEIGRGLVAMGGALAEIGIISGLLGTFAPIAGLVGAGTLLLAIQGLDDLAVALQKFGSMSWDEIGRGLAAMGAAMGEVALGGLLNTLSGFGAAAIAEIAEPLGLLADSVKKWEGVTVPEGLGMQLASLASGIESFTFSGWGADAIAAVAAPIGTMADSIKKWQGVVIPEVLGTQIGSLAVGVKAFNFAGWGADAIAATAPAIGQLADGVRKWQTVSVPDNMGERLTELAKGVESFSFAFVGGWSISSLVEPLGKLSDTVKKWNGVTIPENIQNGLESLADGVSAFNFSFLGGWSIDGIVEPLGNLAGSVKKWNGIKLTDVGTNLTSLANGLKDLGEVGVKGIVKEFDGAAEKINNSVRDILDGVMITVNARKSDVSSAFASLVSEAVTSVSKNREKLDSTFAKIITDALDAIKKKYSNFKSAGIDLMKNLVNGMDSQKKTFKNSITTAVTEMVSSIRGNYNSFYSAGSYLVSGFANGISSNKAATNAARTLAKRTVAAMQDELQIHSPSRVVRDKVGKYVVEGLTEGITSDMSAEDAASKKAQNITNAFQEEFEKLDVSDQTSDLERQLSQENEDYTKRYESQLKRVELALGKYENMLKVLGETAVETQQAYNEYLQEEIDLRDLEAEKTQAAYEQSIALIEERRAANNLSLIEELSAWKRLQSEYVEGSQQRIEIDQKVLDIQQQLEDATTEYYENLSDIQEESNQKRLDIDQDYYDQKQSIMDQEQQEEIRLQEEYAQRTQEINDQLIKDIEDVQKAYDDAVSSRADSLYGSYGLFDEVGEQEAVSGDTLIENLKDQLSAFSDWTSNLNSLTGRGVDEALIEELRELGPSSAAQIEALAQMSDEQLNEYVELWRSKHELAKEQAVYELEDMRVETQNTIAQLNQDAQIELEEYRKTWQEELDRLHEDTDDQLRELKNTWRDRIAELEETTAKQLEDLKDRWMETVTGLKEETENEFSLLASELVDTLGQQNQWSETGANIIEGVLSGIIAHTPELVDGVEKAMREALDAANETLGINSPSKEFEKVGRYSDEGFVVGLKRYAGLVSETASNVGNTALESIRTSISMISNLVENDIDSQPRITPVLDLSNVREGASQLNTMFSRNQALSISGEMARKEGRVTDDDVTETTRPRGNVYQFTQNNYSPKALSRVDIYRQTKNQFSAFERTAET